jgi:hypothetical protein
MDDKKVMSILAVCVAISVIVVTPCWVYVKTHAPYCQYGE